MIQRSSRTRILLLALPIALSACTEAELRTGIKVEVTSDDPIMDYATEVVLILDPDEPLLDAPDPTAAVEYLQPDGELLRRR